ncbi:MAG: hypothetical protein SEPTF4163_002824 [Sporothrix epigloea]
MHDHATKDAAIKRGHMLEGALVEQGRVTKNIVKKHDNAIKGVDKESDWYDILNKGFRRNWLA